MKEALRRKLKGFFRFLHGLVAGNDLGRLRVTTRSYRARTQQRSRYLYSYSRIAPQLADFYLALSASNCSFCWEHNGTPLGIEPMGRHDSNVECERFRPHSGSTNFEPKANSFPKISALSVCRSCTSSVNNSEWTTITKLVTLRSHTHAAR